MKVQTTEVRNILLNNKSENAIFRSRIHSLIHQVVRRIRISYYYVHHLWKNYLLRSNQVVRNFQRFATGYEGSSSQRKGISKTQSWVWHNLCENLCVSFNLGLVVLELEESLQLRRLTNCLFIQRLSDWTWFLNVASTLNNFSVTGWVIGQDSGIEF